MTRCPPIALFIYARADCTRRVLEAIRPARPERLFVVADGPRAGRPKEAAACEEARKVVAAGINWPCEVRRNYAAQNLGCARRVSSGLDWVFSQTEKAIVLEDDCVPEPEFLAFAEELLRKFEHSPEVGVVAGSNFQRKDVTAGAGYYFSRYPHCWGWATWRRAWQAYDHKMREWPEAKRDGWLRTHLGSSREANYWGAIFDRVAAGEIDSWAYRWTFACWRRGFLTALPAANLVTNIGFGAGATHTREEREDVERKAWNQPWPLRHPSEVRRNVRADRYTFRHHFQPSRWLRLRCRLRRMFPFQ